MSNDYQMKLCVHVVLLYLSVSKSAKIRIISIFIWIIFINHNLQAERHEYLYGLSQSPPKKQGGGRSGAENCAGFHFSFQAPREDDKLLQNSREPCNMHVQKCL